MNFKRIAVWLLCALALPASVTRAQFSPGDILLNDFTGSQIQQYSPSGSLLQTFTGTGMFWEGASLTPGGNLVTTFRSPLIGVDIFSPNGTQIASFATPQVNFPGDVSVFPDGILAVNDQLFNGNIDLYDQSGSFQGVINVPGLNDPFGSTTTAPNGTLWAADTGANQLYNISEGGAVLANFATSFQPSDLVVDPSNGTLWVSDRGASLVHHLTASGLTLGGFATPGLGHTDGIGMAPDGTLWVTSEGASSLYHFSQTGTPLGSFPLINQQDPLFLTVVPAPEPGSLTLGAIGLGIVALLARRSARRRPMAA